MSREYNNHTPEDDKQNDDSSGDEPRDAMEVFAEINADPEINNELTDNHPLDEEQQRALFEKIAAKSSQVDYLLDRFQRMGHLSEDEVTTIKQEAKQYLEKMKQCVVNGTRDKYFTLSEQLENSVIEKIRQVAVQRIEGKNVDLNDFHPLSNEEQQLQFDKLDDMEFMLTSLVEGLIDNTASESAADYRKLKNQASDILRQMKTCIREGKRDAYRDLQKQYNEIWSQIMEIAKQESGDENTDVLAQFESMNQSQELRELLNEALDSFDDMTDEDNESDMVDIEMAKETIEKIEIIVSRLTSLIDKKVNQNKLDNATSMKYITEINEMYEQAKDSIFNGDLNKVKDIIRSLAELTEKIA